MTKSLMISIQPQPAVNILNGDKILELRTWIPKGYVGWVYAYVTKGVKDVLHKYKDKYYTHHYLTFIYSVEALNSKVAFRFWFDEYVAYKYYEDDNSYFAKRPQDFGYHAEEVLKRLCLSRDEFKAYGKGKDLYAWHIKKLEVFDEPKSLSDFYVTNKGLTYKSIKEYEEQTNDNLSFRLTKPPQRSVWVYERDII